MRVLGFMTGTSLDGVDMAVLETDGEAIHAFGPASAAPMPESLRADVLDAVAAARRWERCAPEPNLFAPLEVAVADAHFEAGVRFLAAHGLTWRDIDLIGMHGQTVLHRQPDPVAGHLGRSRQLGDAQHLADRAGVPVAYAFRDADVAAGGHGAPLAPAYHAALIRRSGMRPPAAVLNLGGVANLTLVAADGALSALDTGPGNGLLDQWAERHGHGRFDADGRLALAGSIEAQRLRAMLAHPYLARPAPKSLDRYDFDLASVEGLTAEDGAATLAAFTAECVALALRSAGVAGASLIVAGGGRRNPAILRELSIRTRRPIVAAEALGWRGDAVEAELFAYLAARTAHGLAISFPGTTGAPAPMTGGRIARPRSNVAT